MSNDFEDEFAQVQTAKTSALSSPRDAGQRPLPSPSSDPSRGGRKRKSFHESDDCSCDEPPVKKNCDVSVANSLPLLEAGPDECYGSDVRWEEYFGTWPARMSAQDMGPPSRGAKRSHTPSRSNSYSQRVRDGDSPAPWTRRHEERMEDAGIFMTDIGDQARITDDCHRLCDRLLKAEYSMPANLAYQPDQLKQLLRRVRFCNEARVVRDIMSIVVPSPELLTIRGHAELSTICEAMDAEWTQCATLCGPRPKPDFVAGISAATFTTEEKEKLQLNHTSACPNFFPENMYFPFLICEAKGSDGSIEEAERQAMHSASIATRAVIELFRKISATAEVDGKILTFSVAHNHTTALIFAHFAKIEHDKTSFYRTLIINHRFADDVKSTGWTKSYQIVRAIYDHFVPQHVGRIRDALARLRSPFPAASTAQSGVEDSLEASAAEQSSSYEDGPFKKPSLPASWLREENNRTTEKFLEQLRLQREQMEKQMAQQKEEMQKQFAQQLAQQQEIISLQLLKMSKATSTT